MTVLDTRIGRMGLLPFLAALAVVAAVPLLSAHHQAGPAVGHAATSCSHPGEHAATHDHEAGGPSAGHDHEHCLICHLTVAAQGLLPSSPDADGAPTDPVSDVLPAVSNARRGRISAPSFLVRAPPMLPRTTPV